MSTEEAEVRATKEARDRARTHVLRRHSPPVEEDSKVVSFAFRADPSGEKGLHRPSNSSFVAAVQVERAVPLVVLGEERGELVGRERGGRTTLVVAVHAEAAERGL